MSRPRSHPQSPVHHDPTGDDWHPEVDWLSDRGLWAADSLSKLPAASLGSAAQLLLGCAQAVHPAKAESGASLHVIEGNAEADSRLPHQAYLVWAQSELP